MNSVATVLKTASFLFLKIIIIIIIIVSDFLKFEFVWFLVFEVCMTWSPRTRIFL